MFTSRKEAEPAPPAEPRPGPGPVPATAKAEPTREPARPTGMPGHGPTGESAAGARPSDGPGARRLIVGQGITLAGEITACDRLVVEGTVKVALNRTRVIEISETGRFTEGRAEVDEAEISGVYEGELSVRKRLLIRGTGRVSGTVRYGEIEIERGGRLSGAVAMIEGTS
jgi:cytoskeletal protein CcmA (bactofilin family)